MLDGEQPDRLWLGESDRFEQRHDVVRDSELVLLGVADLVVSQFERNGEPVPPEVQEPDLERLHHVLLRDSLWRGGWELFERSGESAPSDVETSGEFVEVAIECEIGVTRRIEIGRETTGGFTDAHAHRRSALHDA